MPRTPQYIFTLFGCTFSHLKRIHTRRLPSFCRTTDSPRKYGRGLVFFLRTARGIYRKLASILSLSRAAWVSTYNHMTDCSDTLVYTYTMVLYLNITKGCSFADESFIGPTPSLTPPNPSSSDLGHAHVHFVRGGNHEARAQAPPLQLVPSDPSEIFLRRRYMVLRHRTSVCASIYCMTGLSLTIRHLFIL